MNSEQQQQRIIGYFIEEAREHLQTIEQGVLNLQNILEDSESINEVFRAAHSIKGGAAMLGVGSVQHVAHRLEDFFKIIKDTPSIKVDERLTSLLLAGFDPLEELLDELEGNFKVSEESTNVAISRVKPIFNELEAYLNQLVTEADESEGQVTFEESTSDQEIDDLFEESEIAPSQESIFQEEITTKMRDMLQLFRSEDDVDSRSQLQEICNYFQQIGNQFNLRNWSSLVTQVKNAIAQPSNSYRTLAPIVIRELKESQDLVLAKREEEIVVSAKMQSLLPYRFAEPEDDEISTIFTTAASNVFDEPIINEWQTEPKIAEPSIIERPISDVIDPDIDIDLFADGEDDQIASLVSIADSESTELDWIDGDYEITDNSHIDGPKVGASELKSLAVLFENDDIDFESAWEDMESNESQIQNQSLGSDHNNQDDFADLLTDQMSESDDFDLSLSSNPTSGSSIEQLFGEFPSNDSALSESDALFPEDLDNSADQNEQDLGFEVSDRGEIDSESTTSEMSVDIFWEQPVETDLPVSTIDDISTEDISGIDFSESVDSFEALPSLSDYSVAGDQIDFDGLFTESSVNGQNEDFDFGGEMIDQTDHKIDYVESSQFEHISQTLMEFDEVDLSEPEMNSSNSSEVVADELEPLTSEAFFASLAEQDQDITFEDELAQEISESEFSNEIGIGEDESDISDDDIPNDPFALTTSEERMTLLDDPFMIDESLDQVLLENAELAEELPISSDANVEANISDSDINIFDELGFDSDDFEESEELTSLQDSEGGAGIDEFGLSLSEAGSFLDDLSDDPVIKDSPVMEKVDSISALGDFFDDPSDIDEDSNSISIADITDVNAEFNELDLVSHGEVVDKVEDFLTGDRDSIEQPQIELNVMEMLDAENDSEVSRVEEIEDFEIDFNDGSEADNVDLGLLETDAHLDDQVVEGVAVNEEFDSISTLGDFFNNPNDIEEDVSSISVTNADITDLNDEFNELIIYGENVDEVEDFLTGDRMDIEQPQLASNVMEMLDVVDDYGISSTSDLEDFFADPEVNEDSSLDWANVSESSIISEDIEDADPEESLIDFAADLETDAALAITDELVSFDKFMEQDSTVDIADIDSGSSDNIETSFESSVLDFADLDMTDVDSNADFLEQADLSEDSDLVSLFASDGEDELSLLENNFDDGFDDARSPVQLEDNIPDQEFSFDINDENGESTDIDNGNGDITVGSTLDSLADFFQGESETEADVLSGSSNSEVEPDLLFDDNYEIGAQFDDFANDSVDLGDEDNDIQFEDINSNSSDADNLLQNVYPIYQEELNGIDDDFNFDDLEEMIGSQSTQGNLEVAVPSHSSFDSQGEDSSIQDDSLTDIISDDMNFDDLEALLSESSDLPASADFNRGLEPEPSKPSDDFDELENMLQSAFAKDVGPIKTKAANRAPAVARKPRLTDSTMRVDVKYLDSLNNLVGELVVNRNLLEQDQERLQQFITNLLHQVQLLSDVSQKMRDEYDKSLLEASLSAGRSRSFSVLDSSYANDSGSSVSSVSRDFEGIEFDRYNKFHILSQEIIELIVRVRESASDIEFVVGETDQVTRQLGTITTQIQDDLKQSRMVPFAQIADRLPRGIRDRALKTGKQAELEIFGRETLIDKAILESLTDPLTHLVNNAIDHGLEDPATRQEGGKVGTGHLTVRAYHQGNQTVISISDDGAGIDPQKVKKSAVAKRVRTQSEVDQLIDTEVYALLFEPGFSTAAQADEFKGRGVGLDVVKTCLDDIRGVIIVESEIGRGTTFTIRLPLTLSISKAMFCISDRARIAFPVDGFEDMVEVPQSQIILNEKGQPCLPWRDTLLPFQHLSNLLAYSRHLSRSSIYGKQENDELCIIILRNDTNYLALQVDQFLGEYEIVIKQLEGPIPQPAGIAGATVLGDGRVMAIANVLELFDIASGRLRPSTSSIVPQVMIEEDVAVDPTVLIVDDSITVRELLSLTFAKVGYRVEQAKDGQDAWEKLRAGLPCDMIFCDIEMPRMDGLDLLSRLQKDARLKDIPVAMLTSRGADRHRQSAIQLGAKGYFTKPYLEEELLSASKRLLAGETLPI
ncbi:MAG: hypothetical protein AUK48_07450 [Oscillatoriales cyanobacterium CG2_30_44_21]|nr:MAG: hypothetical protein AUK48_07450 [Oscillatoriales cyanobacterium CG2_30_44_21]